MLVLYFSQLSINSGDSFDPSFLDTPDPPSFPINTIPRCVPWNYDDCYTLAYVGEGRVQTWVEEVAKRNSIPANETRQFSSGTALNSFLVSNPNRTQAAYIFTSDSLTDIDNGNVRFVVQYNETNQFEFPLDSTNFHTTTVVPAMIHQMNLFLFPIVSNKQYDITIRTSVFPHPNIVALGGSDGDAGVDAFGQYGPLMTFATYFLVVVFFLYKIIDEKERGLREAMKLAGQMQYMHFISWCVPYLLLNLLNTLLLIAFGHIFSFKYFTVHPFSIVFLTFFIFSLSLISWTLVIAALVRRTTSVSVIAFNIFIGAYILATSGAIVYQIDNRGEPLVGESVFFLRQLFAIFPSTMFVKALTDGSIIALQGVALTFETAGEYTDIFPITECWAWMAASGGVAFLLALYLDNVVASQHGIALSPIYFLSPSYWGIGRNAKPNFTEAHKKDQPDVEFTERTAVNTYDATQEDMDVRAEREAVERGDRDSAALVMKNVSRRFKNFVAVDDVSFSVEKDTAFALLGHNGAGKSTLFKMIVTALRPSSGDIHIFGLSAKHHPTEVRRMLGVCPQFDIYWDKLTGLEHVEVFAALRGMQKAERKLEAEERLQDVGLIEKKDVYAGAYSGGMQRRLSVALALTGDPKVVMLDECTSGADPLVRRALWATIQRAKQNRVIFMITHSIAEAQHIAGHDAIGIMAKGKLRVLGKAMHLKTKFGAGYKVLVVLRGQEDAVRLEKAFNSVCPDTKLLSGSLGDNGEWLAEYGMSRLAGEAQVLQAIQFVEEQREEFGIMDYSLNSTTLGEVFKSITSLSEDVNEDEQEEGITKKRSCCC